MPNSKKIVLRKPFWSDWNTQRQGQIAKTAYKATLLISSMKADHSIIAAQANLFHHGYSASINKDGIIISIDIDWTKTHLLWLSNKNYI